jgi:hypothetical protein
MEKIPRLPSKSKKAQISTGASRKMMNKRTRINPRKVRIVILKKNY